MSEKTVFVSYSSKDRRFVNEIVSELETMGICCWKAPENIPAGSSYAREIPKAIANCEVFLLMLSKTSQDSIWVEKETDNAITNRRNMIPFVLDDAPLNDAFRFYLNNVQMISYYEDPKWAMEELKKQLASLVDLKAKDIKEGTASVLPVKKTEQKATGQKSGLSTNWQQSNALRVNRIPMECQYCGSKQLENVTLGTYRCSECGKDNFDDFQTIRNYLNQAGSASVLSIEKNTGVPRKIINHFFREEFLELADNTSNSVTCQECGKPIRTGIFCETCKRKKGIRSGTGSRAGLHGSWYT